ncbi:hypothetical protein [Paracoccus rhizosphaerae]|uniref:Gluconate 2-dehydrogenase subunit 3 n=1 Tax=Paracoccus rhizosphaerae TaxID=1133347 RepID=A0ABV6CF86_9RHOB|nr:hypothetical protein [Paracoccus rhizosphaerae]
MALSRRVLLAMLAGGTLAAAGGVAFVGTLSDEDLAHAILERYLGPIRMASEDRAAFLAAVRDQRPWLFPAEKLAAFYGVAERLDLTEMARRNLPGERGRILENFERHLLGDFLLLTDFAFRTTAEDQVHFLGRTACLNPFASFA